MLDLLTKTGVTVFRRHNVAQKEPLGLVILRLSVDCRPLSPSTIRVSICREFRIR